ncbi:MAG: 50S ribosomal protein L3 [Symbiobacteriia bacterium]
MKKAILGKKLGMTQVFDAQGRQIPVTVIEAGPCKVLVKKTQETDGYAALQIAFGDIKPQLVNKPMKGQFARAGAEPRKWVRELRLESLDGFEVGSEIKADIFAANDLVDVVGISRGKGFAGGIKRWNFHRGPMAHGSKYHRGPGSLGMRISGGGGKVIKGRRLPGRLGGEQVTIQGLRVVRVDTDRNLLLIKGAVPGAKGSLLTVKNSVKAR